MTTSITGYLINPKAGTISYATIDQSNQLQSIYALLECDRIDIVAIGKKHIVYCDDNGLTDGLECITELVGLSAPLAGNLLVTGVDSEGESVSPSHTISAAADLFTIARPVLDPQFEQINEPNVFGVRIKGFAVRIERSKPQIFVPEMER